VARRDHAALDPRAKDQVRRDGRSLFLIYCCDYQYSTRSPSAPDRWPDHARSSNIEPLFVCTACGKRGADVRPDFATGPFGPVAAMGNRSARL
jgi:hypothetical protein